MKGTEIIIIVAAIVVMGGIIAFAVTRDNGPSGDNDGDTNPEPTTPTVNRYSVSISVDGSGTVTGGGTYPLGTEVSATATPSVGYRFEAWYAGDKLLSVRNPFLFSVQSDQNLTAKFERIEYTITLTTPVSYPVQGTVSGGGKYFQGEKATLVATPANGYMFSGWYYKNNPWGAISTDSTYIFEVNVDIAIDGKFELIRDASYTVHMSSTTAPTTITFVANHNDKVESHLWLIEDSVVGEHFPNGVTTTKNDTYTVTINYSCTVNMLHVVTYYDGKKYYYEEDVIIG